MKLNFNFIKLTNFRLRKTLHYSLLASILLLQIIIAGFFYNEYTNRKALSFIEKQLEEVKSYEKLTKDSKDQLINAQDNLQKYIITKKPEFLKSYFTSVDSLTKNLDLINTKQSSNKALNKALATLKTDTLKIKNLKALVDTTHQFSTRQLSKIDHETPKLQPFNFNYNLDQYDVKVETFSDTIAKKGLFGRVRDAIAGKETVRKDSTVVTLKDNKKASLPTIKSQLDRIKNDINNHYTIESKKISITNHKSEGLKTDFYKSFNKLLTYSNSIMTTYDTAINNAKEEFENELILQNSKTHKIRVALVIGLMALMFLVSLLILYFTRLAFLYEQRLNAANDQIKEHLNFKNRILGMLSHELRSPLKIIGIFLNRISKRTDDLTIKDDLKSISFTNNTLLMQANQILEYTKNQQIENKLIPVEFNLKTEIQSILTAIAPYIETRNNKFITTIDINPDLNVNSDKNKINQLFMNILGNANKFTENGTISVYTKIIDTTDKQVIFEAKIEDTGAGISKSDLEKIFEPYYQGILSKDVENIGAGLGLSLCKEFVKLYDGNITMTSEKGKGTTVIFTLYLNLHNG